MRLILHRAFSNLVADNQYAALGLMLMGTLARLKTIVKPWSSEEASISVVEDEEVVTGDAPPAIAGLDLGEVMQRKVSPEPMEMESTKTNVLVDEDDEDSRQTAVKPKEKKRKSAAGQTAKSTSVLTEEVESRGPEGEGEDSLSVSKIPESKKGSEFTTQEKLKTVATNPTTTKRLKKQRKKGDAFDDIFASLV